MKVAKFIELAQKRFKSEEDYLKFQQFQARWVISDLSKIVDFSDKVVLDLGAGIGGYTIELAGLANIVYAIDLNTSKTFPMGENIVLIKGDATNIPLKDNSIDFVFCSSLIEHISDQNKLLLDIHRILTDDGFCYLSFPPFYSPVGGHQFKPFHLLGEKNGIRFSKIFKNVEHNSYGTAYGNWGLYPTTINHIKKLLLKTDFDYLYLKPRFWPLIIAKIPVLNEVLTWHIEFLLQRVKK